MLHMYKKIHLLINALVVAWGLVLPVMVLAGEQITAEEIRLLPSYCRGLGPATYEPDALKYATGTFPKNMPHAHHYCHGLQNVLRANKNMGKKSAENYALGVANGHFKYVLNHTKAENTGGRYNAYLAMASTENGKVLKRQGNTAEAMQMFQQAINYNPKLPQAYAGLSDLYRDLGMIKEAREILEQGLKRVPKSKSLQRRLDKL